MFDSYGVDFLKEIDHLKCKRKLVSALWQPLFLTYFKNSSAFLYCIFFLPFQLTCAPISIQNIHICQYVGLAD